MEFKPGVPQKIQNLEWINNEISFLYEDKNWPKIELLLLNKTVQDLFKTTDLAIQLYEKIFSTETRLHHYADNNDEKEENEAKYKIFSIFTESMGLNPDNLQYLIKIFNEKKVPESVVKAIKAEDTRYVVDNNEPYLSYPNSEFYKHVVNGLAKINTPEAIRSIEKMLIDIDIQDSENFQKQIKIYYKKNGEPSEEEKEFNEWLDDAADSPEDYFESFDNELNDNFDGGITDSFKFFTIKKLEGIGDGKTIDTFIDYIVQKKEQAFKYLEPFLEAFRQIDQKKSVSALLDLSRSSKDPIVKRAAISLLHRIEIGQIGISEEGVKYLEKTYDLGEYNNPEFYVERLTPKGQIGIFDEEKKLIKYFELGDITSEEENVKAEVLDFIYDTLFYPKAGETEEEREKRLKYLEEFKKKYYELANNAMFSETGVRLNNLTFKEQGSFLQYMSGAGDTGKLKEFLSKYRENGIRTFVSTQQGGPEMGNKILSLGEKLPEDTVKMIFAKYGEILDSVDRAEEEIKNLYKNENIPNEVFKSIKETLLKKGVELLSELAEKTKDEKGINAKEIFNELERIKTQTIIMGSSYIELYKQGIKVPIEDISNTSLESISAQNLTEEEKQELMQAYEKGRPVETYENEEHIKLLRDEFEQTLNKKDTFVFNVRFNNEIVAFATFNRENEDTLHVGGLTFIEDVRNPAIAVAVLSSIMKEFSKFNIKALVHSKNKIWPMYEKRFGFKKIHELNSEKELKENAGEIYYEIERPKNVPEEEKLEKAA